MDACPPGKYSLEPPPAASLLLAAGGDGLREANGLIVEPLKRGLDFAPAVDGRAEVAGDGSRL